MSTPAATLTSRGYFLGGEFRSSGEPLEVRSPYDGALVATTCWTPEPEIEEAIRQAGAAFREIAGMPTLRRVEILRRMADLAVARREEIALTLALEAGKPLKVARMEADRTVFTFRNSADEAQNIAHEFLALDAHPAGKDRWGIVRRFPIGPIYAITPFNFPSNLVAHKLGPALAAGNPMVLKPSPKTPMSGLLIAEIARNAGVPAGMLNAICCSNERAEQLAADERFRMLTFTGSAAVGWRLRSRAGKKRVALELGGNAGCVIGADANLDFAAERCASGGFSFAGQSCISVQRIFAHRLVYDRFTAARGESARRSHRRRPAHHCRSGCTRRVVGNGSRIRRR